VPPIGGPEGHPGIGLSKRSVKGLDHKNGAMFLAKPYGAVSLVSKVQKALQKEVSPKTNAQIFER
jgi:FixJ family two-component response regulator